MIDVFPLYERTIESKYKTTNYKNLDENELFAKIIIELGKFDDLYRHIQIFSSDPDKGGPSLEIRFEIKDIHGDVAIGICLDVPDYNDITISIWGNEEYINSDYVNIVILSPIFRIIKKCIDELSKK